MTNTIACELMDIIGDTGIGYCTIPYIDQGENCKQCQFYHTDALTALAKTVVSLQERTTSLEKMYQNLGVI